MTRRFLGAVQFLTVVPVKTATAPPGECAVFYPLVGALVGAAAGAVDLLLSHLLPRQLASLAAVGCLALITGCLHEDGVADLADAVRAQRSREKVFEILKDSRVGSFGAVAVVFSIGLRWQALAAVAISPVVALAIAGAVSRAAMVALAWWGRPLAIGLAADFRRQLRAPLVSVAILEGALAAFGGGVWHGLAVLAANVILVSGARRYFHTRVGGVNGDCLGAVCQTSEFLNLAILACRNFTW